MPFKSQAQWKWMYAAEKAGKLPRGTAARWAHETKKPFRKLPKEVEGTKEAGVREALLLLMSGLSPQPELPEQNLQLQSVTRPAMIGPLDPVPMAQRAASPPPGAANQALTKKPQKKARPAVEASTTQAPAPGGRARPTGNLAVIPRRLPGKFKMASFLAVKRAGLGSSSPVSPVASVAPGALRPGPAQGVRLPPAKPLIQPQVQAALPQPNAPAVQPGVPTQPLQAKTAGALLNNPLLGLSWNKAANLAAQLNTARQMMVQQPNIHNTAASLSGLGLLHGAARTVHDGSLDEGVREGLGTGLAAASLPYALQMGASHGPSLQQALSRNQRFGAHFRPNSVPGALASLAPGLAAGATSLFGVKTLFDAATKSNKGGESNKNKEGVKKANALVPVPPVNLFPFPINATKLNLNESLGSVPGSRENFATAGNLLRANLARRIPLAAGASLLAGGGTYGINRLAGDDHSKALNKGLLAGGMVGGGFAGAMGARHLYGRLNRDAIMKQVKGSPGVTDQARMLQQDIRTLSQQTGGWNKRRHAAEMALRNPQYRQHADEWRKGLLDDLTRLQKQRSALQAQMGRVQSLRRLDAQGVAENLQNHQGLANAAGIVGGIGGTGVAATALDGLVRNDVVKSSAYRNSQYRWQQPALFKRANQAPAPAPTPGTFQPSSVLDSLTDPNSPQARWHRGVVAPFVPQVPPPSQPAQVASGQQMTSQIQTQPKM